jgi:hypothetical protein
MSEQVLHLRRSAHFVRRRKFLVGLIVVLGILDIQQIGAHLDQLGSRIVLHVKRDIWS